MERKVVSLQGKELRSIELSDSVFGLPINEDVIYYAINNELANNRVGTADTKTRGQVHGSNRRPYSQKGTGRARQGTIRAPQFTGGGVAFPPSPRSFDVKVNKKALKAALRSALSDHAAAGTLGLIDAASFETPSAKQAAQLLATWGKSAPTLVVATEGEENLIKSFRNLDRVLVTLPSEIEVAAIVWARTLIVTETALPLVQGRAS